MLQWFCLIWVRAGTIDYERLTKEVCICYILTIGDGGDFPNLCWCWATCASLPTLYQMCYCLWLRKGWLFCYRCGILTESHSSEATTSPDRSLRYLPVINTNRAGALDNFRDIATMSRDQKVLRVSLSLIVMKLSRPIMMFLLKHTRQ